MKKKQQISPAGILLLVLGIILAVNVLSTVRRSNDVTYYELRQLFEQEKVQEFYISDTRLTAKLSDESTVGCDLYDFDLFYDDMNDLVQQQAAAGIIKNYNYWADHSTNWLELLLPWLLTVPKLNEFTAHVKWRHFSPLSPLEFHGLSPISFPGGDDMGSCLQSPPNLAHGASVCRFRLGT